MTPLRQLVAANNVRMPPADRSTADDGVADERWQRPGDDFLRGLLALPELALVDESCAAEQRLHERLAAEPTRPVASDELAAVVDDDARDNYATFLGFRDALLRAG